jgi:hypothetical protein
MCFFMVFALVLSRYQAEPSRARALFLDLNFHAFAFVLTGSLCLPVVRLFIYIARRGEPEQNSQNRTCRMGHAGRDMQDGTCRAEQDRQNRQTRQNRTGRTGQAEQECLSDSWTLELFQPTSFLSL